MVQSWLWIFNDFFLFHLGVPDDQTVFVHKSLLDNYVAFCLAAKGFQFHRIRFFGRNAELRLRRLIINIIDGYLKLLKIQVSVWLRCWFRAYHIYSEEDAGKKPWGT